MKRVPIWPIPCLRVFSEEENNLCNVELHSVIDIGERANWGENPGWRVH
jgi:hypothetical protein